MSHLVKSEEDRLPKNSEKPDDVGESLGEHGGGPTTKESRNSETERPQLKVQTTVKMGRLR